MSSYRKDGRDILGVVSDANVVTGVILLLDTTFPCLSHALIHANIVVAGSGGVVRALCFGCCFDAVFGVYVRCGEYQVSVVLVVLVFVRIVCNGMLWKAILLC